MSKAKVERFQPWLYFFCYIEFSRTSMQQFVPGSLTSDCADKKLTKYSFFFVLRLGLPKRRIHSEVKKMKEFQKGVLDNDRVISAENVQRMGEVIALCAIKTVIVRGGKDLHNLYKGLLRDINRADDDMRRYSDGYEIAQEAMLFLCQHMGKRLNDVYITKTGRKITIYGWKIT